MRFAILDGDEIKRRKKCGIDRAADDDLAP
jgi:hypothetical protein